MGTTTVFQIGDQVLHREDRGDRHRGPLPLLVVDFEDGRPVVAYRKFERAVDPRDLWLRKRGR